MAKIDDRILEAMIAVIKVSRNIASAQMFPTLSIKLDELDTIMKEVMDEATDPA